MSITLNIDEQLLDKARYHTGLTDMEALVRDALKALIERESARRLAKPGGTEPQLKPVLRRGACTE